MLALTPSRMLLEVDTELAQRLPLALSPGRDAPLGALARDGGVNFAVFSQHATRMELCIFGRGLPSVGQREDSSESQGEGKNEAEDEEAGQGWRELRRYALAGPHDGVWSGFLPGAGPGLVYGLRAHGPYAPEQGHRFNPHKLLLDPNARELVGTLRWVPQHYGYEFGHPEGARSFDARDNAATALKARVPPPPRHASARAHAPLHLQQDLVICELHVKGYTMSLAGVPEALRGTYAGLAHPAAIESFRTLGITTLCLLPVQQHLDEPALVARGQTNYWGYNTLAFNAADPRLAQRAHRHDPSAVNEEFRAMVQALHEAGLEVVLDVVYNHTAEGSELGTTLSFRGLDHASWYRLDPHDRSRCENFSGCGNTLNVAHPRVTQFVLDSMRHWVQEMGVDGFRFDLASVLGRRDGGFDPQAPFFTALMQDPVLAGVRLIAEPWDSGHAGYQLGRFPGRWMEWNDKFRDTTRRYWLGAAVGRGEFARRFTASSDVFHHGQRSPLASVNFIAAHDGFTLADFSSYARKHNGANGEDNRDGRDDEICDPLGNPGEPAAEGPVDDAAVQERRRRVRRALLATLALAQGTPMLCAGDEIGNTQGGNNNAYCQDNPVGWLNWDRADMHLRGFVAQALALRRAEPLLRHGHWFHETPPAPGEPALRWLTPQGRPMQLHDWHDPAQRAFACRIDAAPGAVEVQRGEASRSLLLAFNPEPSPCAFALPAQRWRVVLDSSGVLDGGAPLQALEPRLAVPAHALVVLRALP